MLKSIPKSVLLCFLCACWVLPGLFNHEPWKADEPYSFGMVYHILQTGDWVVPTVAGEPFMEKPPLYYVTAAFFARLFSPCSRSTTELVLRAVSSSSFRSCSRDSPGNDCGAQDRESRPLPCFSGLRACC
jgi:hypothetical protein